MSDHTPTDTETFGPTETDPTIENEEVETEGDEGFDLESPSELDEIRQLFEAAQAERPRDFDIPGFDGRFVIRCTPVTEDQWNAIKKKVAKAKKTDKLAERNTQLDTLIAGTSEFRYVRPGETESVALYESAPEIVGVDEDPIAFGDERLSKFFAAFGLPNLTSGRQQLLGVLLNNPLRLQSLFTDYFTWASGEDAEIDADLAGN